MFFSWLEGLIANGFCHSERSEESDNECRGRLAQILRFAPNEQSMLGEVISGLTTHRQ